MFYISSLFSNRQASISSSDAPVATSSSICSAPISIAILYVSTRWAICAENTLSLRLPSSFRLSTTLLLEEIRLYTNTAKDKKRKINVNITVFIVSLGKNFFDKICFTRLSRSPDNQGFSVFTVIPVNQLLQRDSFHESSPFFRLAYYIISHTNIQVITVIICTFTGIIKSIKYTFINNL